ncbi:hypothetical protein DL96DRAFT_1585628 [Flagelloscypha sp. PMI_526]|nr:hypothetical protein DL96DRAFT_1585628 [Flagelloscypha sp. PMI_526]
MWLRGIPKVLGTGLKLKMYFSLLTIVLSSVPSLGYAAPSKFSSIENVHRSRRNWTILSLWTAINSGGDKMDYAASELPTKCETLTAPFDDTVSGIWVEFGATCTFYDAPNCNGDSFAVEGSPTYNGDLWGNGNGPWNDRISSFQCKISQNWVEATLWPNPNFGGQYITLAPSKLPGQCLHLHYDDIKDWNNSISSLQVANGVECTFWA